MHVTNVPDFLTRVMSRFGVWRLSELRLTQIKHSASASAMKPCRHHVPCLRSGGLGPQGAFPNCCNPPARFPKSGLNCCIPRNICIKLGRPKLGARRRNRGIAAACMAMPKATMHEDDGSVLRHHDVRRAGNTLRVKAKTKAKRMQGPTQRQFGPRVLSTDPRHHAGAGLAVEDVCHLPPGFICRTWYTANDLNSRGH